MGHLLRDARLLGRLARARVRGRPWVLSHLLTGRCNAGCATCLWRAGAADSSARGPAEAGQGAKRRPGGPAGASQTALYGAELSTEEVAWLYEQAAAAGIAQLVIWGGEPLLRADVGEVVRAGARAGLSVGLITNGWLLDERWGELRGWVDTLILSLDDTGEAHDRMRKLPGLYGRLDSFARGLRRDPLRPRLLVNCVLSRLNRGALRRVAPVARAWGAGLYFCPMEIGELREGGFEDRKGRLALSPAELAEAARLARLLQEAGYPLRATRRYLDLLYRDPFLRSYSCRAPHAILSVTATGSFRDCLRRDVPLANVRDLRGRGVGLEALFSAPRYRAMLREAESCTVCNNPDVVETSWAWRLQPFMLLRLLSLAGR